MWRLLLATTLAAAALAAGASARADEPDAPDAQYRALCNEGFSYSQIWRGPVRDDYDDAKADLAEHQRLNPNSTDCSVIRKGELLWD
jgi:hypothetical protein